MKLLARLLCFLGLVSATQADERALYEGECWSYAERPDEESSFLVIASSSTTSTVTSRIFRSSACTSPTLARRKATPTRSVIFRLPSRVRYLNQVSPVRLTSKDTK